MSQSDYRANNPNHTGAAEKIREALRRAGSPLSVYRLHLATGLDTKRVHAALMQMVHISGGIVAIKRASRMEYDLFERAQPIAIPKQKTQGEFAVAGQITHGRGSKWWSGIV